MTTLAKTKKSLFPSRISDFLNPTRFFDSDLLDLGSDFYNWNFPKQVPSVNITENTGDYLVEMAAPGLEKNDFKIEVDNHTMTISAEKEDESKEKTKAYTRKEYSYSSFSRSFQLPENVVGDKVSAKYENGVLLVTVPKKEIQATSAKKEIKVG
jgi:HSP20 family protein